MSDRPLNDLHLWIRSETRATERRVPITPRDAADLVHQGARVSVEESSQRVFDIGEYAQAGARVEATGSWVDAPSDAYIVGIKELPEEPAQLRHAHIFFAHAYKGQDGSAALLDRFAAGGGELLDVEYLSVAGRRVVAFGHWAGYVGAALAVLQHRDALRSPLVSLRREVLDQALSDGAGTPGRALVIGARGRSGRGATEALRLAGWDVTAWGMSQTRDLDKATLLEHDLLANCIVSGRPQEPLVTHEDLDASERALAVIADVTCDVTSEHNVLPINTAVTTWDEPVRTVGAQVGSARSVDVIAIDNLPSLLPLEASVSFSADFTPLMAHLAQRSSPFAAARAAFETAAGSRREHAVR